MDDYRVFYDIGTKKGDNLGSGEFDTPNAKTVRMQRELKNFKSVILPGKSHLTAIMAGYIPELYIQTLVDFINANDPKR
jgi:hypothetical protein